jgi:hypothetical protein
MEGKWKHAWVQIDLGWMLLDNDALRFDLASFVFVPISQNSTFLESICPTSRGQISLFSQDEKWVYL